MEAGTWRRHKGPGKANRKGLTLIQITDLFPTDAAAEAWFVERRWLQGAYCPYCGSFNPSSAASSTRP